MELRKLLTLDTESLILSQMPVKNIQLDRRHRIEIALENLRRLIVTGDIDQQTTPGKTRLIINLDAGK